MYRKIILQQNLTKRLLTPQNGFFLNELQLKCNPSSPLTCQLIHKFPSPTASAGRPVPMKDAALQVCTRTCPDFPDDKLTNKIIQTASRQLYSNNYKGTHESVKKHHASNKDKD